MHLKQLCYAILVLMLNEITTEFCKPWRMRIYLDSHFIYITSVLFFDTRLNENANRYNWCPLYTSSFWVW